MEIGLFTEFQCPLGMDEARAFDESLAEMTAAEEMGFDAVWLAEIHFQKDGTPEAVTERLQELRLALGDTTLSVWMNVGGRIPHERVLGSMRLFAERVIPRLS